MQHFLDFEQAIAVIEGKIKELRHITDDGNLNILEEITRLQTQAEKILEKTYSKLTPWQRVQVARHPERPHCIDYIDSAIEDFIPLAGDRNFAHDAAMVGGLGKINGKSIMIIGQEKGMDTESRLSRNFGMVRPEGYRKAIRLMDLADRFDLPVISFIDTPGAYPGIGAEERGQAEAIASCIRKCLSISVPMISVIIGEGGSGGAIAIGAASKVLMLENAIYSVISPEGCGSILWKDDSHAEEAAESLKLTAPDLKKLGVIDEVISEPIGGAHRDAKATISDTSEAITEVLNELNKLTRDQILTQRKERFTKLGLE